MFVLNRDNVISLLTQAMETQGPEFQYVTHNKCLYNPHPEDRSSEGYTSHLSGCLIGTMFSINGSPIPDSLSAQSPYGSSGTVIWVILPELIERGKVQIPSEDVALLTDVLRATQQAQDNGSAWGRCVETAKLVLSCSVALSN